MRPGVQIAAKSNSWGGSGLLHGVGFCWIQELLLAKIARGLA